MDRKTWKRLRRSATWVPVAFATAPLGLWSQGTAFHGVQEPGTWTFHHEHVLGTSLQVRVHAGSFAEASRAESAALNEFDRQDALLSAWRPDSEFSRWVSTRFEPIKVSPELFAMLAGFDRWRAATDGALDASAEAAVRLWRGALAEGRTPTDAEIAATREAIAQPHWQLNASTRTAMRVSDVPLALASFTKSFVSARAAEAAMQAGATGVMLNVGGDVVVRGAIKQTVDIADPLASAENDPPFASVVVRDAAVATSGSYRRGLERSNTGGAPRVSHIVDPRSAQPAGAIVSSTVIAHDPETAGALATAFCILQPAESAQLASNLGAEYMLVTREGERIESSGWSRYQAPGVRTVSYAPQTRHVTAPGVWNPAFALNLSLDLPRIEDARYRRPYVAIWIEDADHFPVRTLALWTQNPRWLPELKQWYRDDQIRNLSEGTDISKTISSATRPPGHYTITWDGKDNEGTLVKAGKYTVVMEGSREHGGYQIERHEMDFDGQPQQANLPAGKEIGAVTLDYRKR